jgi:hypothetical protein
MKFSLHPICGFKVARQGEICFLYRGYWMVSNYTKLTWLAGVLQMKKPESHAKETETSGANYTKAHDSKKDALTERIDRFLFSLF